MFSVIMTDINKALCVKVYIDPKTKLPQHFYGYLPVFDQKAASQLPPLRGKGINHVIELEQKEDRTEPEVP